MRWPDKVTALHLLTHRIVFVNAPYCVFSFTSHLPVFLSCWTCFSICPRWCSRNGSLWDPEICDWARAEPSLLELCRAWANWTTLNKLFAFAHRKHLIFFWMRYGQDDICVLTTHCSQLITQTPTTTYHPLPVLRHPRWFVSCASYYIM
mgnify:CR=1 FL=1